LEFLGIVIVAAFAMAARDGLAMKIADSGLAACASNSLTLGDFATGGLSTAAEIVAPH
jgi:hypothetical protein